MINIVERSFGIVLFLLIPALCQAMDPPPITNASRGLEFSIERLLFDGYQSDWEDNFQYHEESSFKKGIGLKMLKKSQEALGEFFAAAQRGSLSAMYHISMLSSDKEHAQNWLRLACLISFQRSGVKHLLSANNLAQNNIYLTQLKDEKLLPEISNLPNLPKTIPLSDEINTLFQTTHDYFAALKSNPFLCLSQQVARWELVQEELRQWFRHDEAKIMRTSAFILLCIDASSLQVNYASSLIKQNILPQPELFLTLERLLDKVINNNHAQVFINKDTLSDLFRENENSILNALYQKDTAGIFGIPDSHNELSKRCLKVNTPLGWSFYALLIRESKILLELNPQARALEAQKWLEQAQITDSLMQLGEMYYYGDLGQDLSEAERLRKAIGYWRQCPVDEARRNELTTLMRLQEHQEYIDLAKALFDTTFFDKGYLHLALCIGYINLNQNNFLDPLREKIYEQAKFASALGYGQFVEEFLSAFENVNRQKVDNDVINIEAKEALPSTFADSVKKSEILMPPKKSRKLAKKQRHLQKHLLLMAPTNLKNLKAKKINIEFISVKIREDFENLAMNDKKKIDEFYQDIAQKPWGVDGSGQPERLKHFGKYGGLLSRQINYSDRLVYDYIGNDTILIYSCLGHY